MNRFQKLLLLFVVAFCFYFNRRQFLRNSSPKNECQLQKTGSDQGKDLDRQAYDICTGVNMTLCVAPLVKYSQKYRLSKPHSLLACAIEKNFSTFLTAIMCYLTNPKKFIEANRTLDRDIYATRLCKNLNEFDAFSKIKDSKKLRLLAVVRHPIHRFVSGFVDKCLKEQVWKKYKTRCAGCKTNLTCFVDKMYTRMRKYPKHPYKNIDFDDSHFFPQSWRCEFSSLISRYTILKLDDLDFPNQFLDVLAERKVADESMVYINNHFQQHTQHSTLDSTERQTVEYFIKNSRYLTKKLIQMYYFDFLLFGYPLPVVPFR